MEKQQLLRSAQGFVCPNLPIFANLRQNRPKNPNSAPHNPRFQGLPGPIQEISKRFFYASFCYYIIHHETAFGAKNLPNNKILQLGKSGNRLPPNVPKRGRNRPSTDYCNTDSRAIQGRGVTNLEKFSFFTRQRRLSYKLERGS